MERLVSGLPQMASRRDALTRVGVYAAASEQIGSARSGERGVGRDAVPDVRLFGAVGDGLNDDAPAIQEALDVAGAVFLPYGTWRFSRSIVLKSGNLVRGSSRRSYPTASPHNNTLIAPDPGVDAFILPATGDFHDLTVEGLHIILSGELNDPDRVALHGKRIGLCGFFCPCRDRYEVLQNALFRELTITHQEMGKGCGFFFQRMPYSSTFERLWLHGLEHGIAVGVYGTRVVEQITGDPAASTLHVANHGLAPDTSIAFYWDLAKDWESAITPRQVYQVGEADGDGFTVADAVGGRPLVLPELPSFPVYIARAGASFDEWYSDANTFLSVKMQACETNLVLANMSASFFYNLEIYSGALSFAILTYPSRHRAQNWGLGFFGFYNEGPYAGYHGPWYSLLEGNQCTFIGRIYSPLYIRGDANTFRTIVQPRVEQRSLGPHDVTIIDGHQNRLEFFAAYDLEPDRIDDRGVENELRFYPRWSSGRSTLGRAFTTHDVELQSSPSPQSNDALFVPGYALYLKDGRAEAPLDRTAHTRRPLRIDAKPGTVVRLFGWAGTNSPATSWRLGQSVPRGKGLCLCRLRAAPALALDMSLVAGDDRIGHFKFDASESWSLSRFWYDSSAVETDAFVTLELALSRPAGSVFVDWVLLTPFTPQIMAGSVFFEQRESPEPHPIEGTAELRYDAVRQKLVLRLPDGSDRVVAFELGQRE